MGKQQKSSFPELERALLLKRIYLPTAPPKSGSSELVKTAADGIKNFLI
jgi:hypothetical protein